ncbi:MAG: hypothetical protein AABX37_01560 [Nanoarchaeota archaeon]
MTLDSAATKVVNLYGFLAELQDRFNQDPDAALKLFLDNKGTILETLKHNDRVAAFFLERVNFEEVKNFHNRKKAILTFATEIPSLTSPQQLQQRTEAFHAFIKDEAFTQKIRHLLAGIAKYPEELKWMQQLEIQLATLEQQWNDPNAHPAEQTSAMFKALHTEIPERLRTEFNDPPMAQYIEEYLNHNEEHFQPIPRPGPLKVLLIRIIEALQRPEMQQGRFVQAKTALLQEITREQAELQKHQVKVIDSIKSNTQRLLQQLEVVMGDLYEQAAAEGNLAGLYVSLLALLADKIHINAAILQELQVNPDDATAEPRVASYLEQYLTLVKETDKLLGHIKTMGKVVVNREELGKKSLKRIKV